MIYLILLLLTGITMSADESNPNAGQPPVMTRGVLTLADLVLTADEFENGTSMPSSLSFVGGNQHPTLHWTGVGKTVVEFALVCEDPTAPGGSFIHWVVYNIPGTARALRTKLDRERKIADGTKQGINGFGKIGYDGPKPPKGPPHQYVFMLYSLDSHIKLESGATRHQLMQTIAEQSNIVQTAQLVGLFETK